MIRLSTNQVHERGVQYIRDAQVAVANTQAQIGGGKRILDPSDDPAGSARLVELQHQIAATVETISADQVAEAYDRVVDSKVRYRFVIDTSTIVPE